jgi:hypothetical protein
MPFLGSQTDVAISAALRQVTEDEILLPGMAPLSLLVLLD